MPQKLQKQNNETQVEACDKLIVQWQLFKYCELEREVPILGKLLGAMNSEIKYRGQETKKKLISLQN